MTCGPLRGLVDFNDDDANAVVRRKIFESGLVALCQLAFGLAEFDDDVAVLETLHHAIDDFADMLVIFGENAFAFGFANFLKDDLLGHLRGNAAKTHRGFQELDFLFQLRVGFDPASFVERDFTTGLVTSSTTLRSA